MANLLIGPEAVGTIKRLSTALKAKTKRLAEKADGQSYPAFTPWMSIRPLLDKPISDKALLKVDYQRGDLLTNPKLLGRIATFITGQGREITEKMPVTAEQWPVMTDIAAARPDAIAAFKEGRALLSASPFLSATYSSLVEFVVPQRRARPSGFDSPYAFGAVFRTFPEDRGGLLAGFQLAHAMGHQAALLMTSADPLLKSDPEALIDYEVREDRRSAYHGLVSAVALSYMVMLHHALYGKGATAFIADDHVRGYDVHLPNALKKGVRSVAGQAKLTPVGAKLISEMRTLC